MPAESRILHLTSFAAGKKMKILVDVENVMHETDAMLTKKDGQHSTNCPVVLQQTKLRMTQQMMKRRDHQKSGE